MSEILFINACIRGNSRTLSLAKQVLDRLGVEVLEVKLYEADLAPLDVDGIKARDEASRSKDFSDSRFELACQFASAETIVIAAPYWDLSFPAILKTYFEAVTVNGLTFAYSDKGFPVGLCKAERLVYVTTSGGPMVSNLGFDYVSALAKSFYGIKDVRCVYAEGLDIRGADTDAILLRAKESVKQILS